MDTPSTPRDDRGRFQNGNPGGPGRSPDRLAEQLRFAAETAVSPEHVAAIMRKATMLALQGNLSAMRFVVERVCGRPADAPTQTQAFDLAMPQLSTAANCAAAIDRLLTAIVDGTVDRDVAKTLIDLIQVRLKAIEVTDLEQRLTELEKTASLVDHNGARPMRRL